MTDNRNTTNLNNVEGVCKIAFCVRFSIHSMSIVRAHANAHARTHAHTHTHTHRVCMPWRGC